MAVGPDPEGIDTTVTSVLTHPSAPRQRPLEVARDTFLIRAAVTSSIGTLTSALNSLIIRGAEPVVVDTGMALHRDQWFDDVLSLVEPEDIRWIYVTHDDLDHAGNLVEALDRFPTAGVLVSRRSAWRTSVSFGIAPERIRCIDDGETIELGDRTLRAVRPPVYDSPYTRGVFDITTRMLYAVDAFCAPMPAEPVDYVDEIPPEVWQGGMASIHHHSLCPWVALIDEASFRAEVRKLELLDLAVIVGAHTAAISGPSIGRAFEHLANLPSADPDFGR